MNKERKKERNTKVRTSTNTPPMLRVKNNVEILLLKKC